MTDPVARRELLHAIARAYVTEGLGKDPRGHLNKELRF